ncbi:MAG: dephospho-CoA kinase [Clostridia bacterium]|nr:dephospho-CoA kinase [Clostridia bacterium]
MIIGLTGGIGSGKSTALAALKEKGYKTVSCDEITAELYGKRKILKKLRTVFPAAISGKIFLKADKKEIARQAFSDAQKYAFLTDFLSAATFKIAMKRAKKAKGTVIVEVPLLLENDLAKEFDKVIVVARDKTARIKSVKARSFLSDEQIQNRMSKQIDYDFYDLSPYIVIKNDGDCAALAAAAINAVNSAETI